MKKTITIMAIILATVALGWVGGNIWADRVREAKPIGFDIGTRLTYQTRGITAGGAIGVLITGGLLIGTTIKNRNRESQNNGKGNET